MISLIVEKFSQFYTAPADTNQTPPLVPFPEVPALESMNKTLEGLKVVPRKEYQSLTRKKFAQSIKRPDLTPSELIKKENELCRALEKQDWNSSVFENPEVYAYCALKAVEKGKLDVEQFCTVMFYFSTTKHHKAEEIGVIPLFIEGQVNPEARDFIRQTMEFSGGPAARVAFGDGDIIPPYLTETQIDEFFERMKKLPPSEQQFFLVPDKQPMESEDKDFHPERTITQEINLSAGINIFCRTKGRIRIRMIPSFGMMQTYLNTKFENPVQITPVIGMSTFKEIEKNGRTLTRDMAIPYPGNDLPDTADLYSASLTYDFIYHDFYHAIVASSIPLEHGQAAIHFAGIVSPLKKEKCFEEIKDFIQEFYARIIDLEFGLYRGKNKENIDSVMFWKSINACYFQAFTRLIREKKIKNKENLEDLKLTLLEEMAKIISKIKESGFVDKFFEDLERQERIFKEEFNIEMMQSLTTLSIELKAEIESKLLMLKFMIPKTQYDALLDEAFSSNFIIQGVTVLEEIKGEKSSAPSTLG